jgi:hypothetical protein
MNMSKYTHDSLSTSTSSDEGAVLIEGNGNGFGAYTSATLYPTEHEVYKAGELAGVRSEKSQTKPEDRAAIRSLWQHAVASAKQLVEKAKSHSEEIFGTAVELRGYLDRLWDHRRHRDANWVGILDLTQTALAGIAKEGFENATTVQCEGILELIENYLSSSTKEISDLRAATRIARDAELHLFDGLEPLGQTDDGTT